MSKITDLKAFQRTAGGQSVVKDSNCDFGARNPEHINFDYADQVRRLQAIIRMPDQMQAQIVESSVETANALYQEGGRGPAALRLMARDISLLRIDVAQADTLVALMREKLREDPEFSPRRLVAAVKSSEVAHRNLQAALRSFARLSDPVSPTLHLRGQNYVHFEGKQDR